MLLELQPRPVPRCRSLYSEGAFSSAWHSSGQMRMLAVMVIRVGKVEVEQEQEQEQEQEPPVAMLWGGQGQC